MLYPEVANRSCGHCLDYEYDEETGKVREFNGRLVKRHPKFPAPCRDAKQGCYKGTPENPNTLSDRNLRAYRHWKECRAVNCFPDDGIVRNNAVLIQDAIDKCDEIKRRDDADSQFIRILNAITKR